MHAHPPVIIDEALARELVSVTLDAATVQIMKKLAAASNPDPLSDSPRVKIFKPKKRVGPVLTAEQHNKSARELAVQYTRNIHELGTFASMLDDKRKRDFELYQSERWRGVSLMIEAQVKKSSPEPPERRTIFAPTSPPSPSHRESSSSQFSSFHRSSSFSKQSDRRSTCSVEQNGRVKVRQSSTALHGGGRSPSPTHTASPSPSHRRSRSPKTSPVISRRSVLDAAKSKAANKKRELDDSDLSSDDDSFGEDGEDKKVEKYPKSPEQRHHQQHRSSGLDSSYDDSSPNQDDDDGQGDDASVNSRASNESGSSGDSFMLDIDVVQSRILQKKEDAAAAAFEKEQEKGNNLRKRKSDPIACARSATVELNGAQLDDKWASIFAANMTDAVHFLDFSRNRITLLGLNSLCSSLRPTLRTLKLVAIDMSKGAAAVAPVISYLSSPRSTLLRLDLSECKLGNANCAAICQAIVQNPTLTELDLSHNLISTPGCEGTTLLVNRGARFFWGSFLLHPNFCSHLPLPLS